MIDTECVIIEFDHAKKSYCDMFPFMANEAKISQRCDYIILAVFKDNLFVICIELKTKTEREFKMQLVRGHHFGHYLLSSAYTLVKDSERPRQITLRSLLLKELTGNQQKDTTRIHPDVPYNEPLGPDGKYGRFGYENLGTPLTLSSLCR